MATTTLQQILGIKPITEDTSIKEFLSDLWTLKVFQLGGEPLLTLPSWEVKLLLFGLAFIFLVPFVLLFLPKFFRKTSAFEKIKFKRREIDKSLNDNLYLEITLPPHAQATAFQIQQKILKAFHSLYTDPVTNIHSFSPLWHFVQKIYRFTRVYLSKKVFFTLQIWGEYPDIVFRLHIPAEYYDRIEKALYDAYPGAEITQLDQKQIYDEVIKQKESYLSYGETKIEGKFYHRLKTFKDVSSDPVDSLVATMEGLKEGQFMVYNLCVSPTSHYFNQLIHYLLEEEEREQIGVFDKRQALKQADQSSPDLRSQLRTAKIEKMKASLFQVVISYWTLLPIQQESQAKLANIQSVLSQVNQKNMNILKHKRLFTKQIKELSEKKKVESILAMRPTLKRNRIPYVPLFRYKNYGQIVSEPELYSLWHLANITEEHSSSVKVIKFKKLPATQDMRLCRSPLYINLGNSSFKMHEENRLGIASWEDMKKHVYILGGTGAGKSETLKTILHNFLQKTETEKTALLIIDPKNDFATDLLTMIPENRKDDVVYFNPSRQKEQPLSFPFFSKFSGEKNNDERIDFLISIMKRFVQIDSNYSWGPELENILRQLFATAYMLPEQSLSGLDQLLHEPHQIKNLNKFLPPRLQQFWTDSILKRTSNDLAKYLATTNNKIGKFLDYPEFLNIADRIETKITFEEMIHQKKIFIANLGSSSEQMKKYYSVYLTAHIAEAIFDQARLSNSERKPTVFVVDEFQRVASDIFETLFSEVRAFNTALVISNQFMGQLDQKIQKSIESNIATKIFMRTQSVDDAEIAEKILGEKVTIEDIMNLPTGAAYFKTLVNGIPQAPMSLQIERVTLPMTSASEIESEFIQDSMEKYGTPTTEIKEKRETINSLYYTANHQKEFLVEMERIQTPERT